MAIGDTQRNYGPVGTYSDKQVASAYTTGNPNTVSDAQSGDVGNTALDLYAGPAAPLLKNALGKAGIFKGQAGVDAGNIFARPGIDQPSQQAMTDFLGRGANAGGAEVMQDPMNKQYYGQDMQNVRGDIAGARSEQADLASRGYSLKPEDYEAYGQAGGNIARQFGQAETGLSEALANRGMSTSGAANQAFMTSQGSKLEQLGGLQRQIAQDRMNMNLQRLGQTRQFMGQLQNQEQGMMGQYQGAVGEQNRLAQAKGEMGQGNLGMEQQQSNINLAQRMATQKASPFSRFLGAAAPLAGQAAGTALGGPAGGMAGGAAGGALSSAL